MESRLSSPCSTIQLFFYICELRRLRSIFCHWSQIKPWHIETLDLRQVWQQSRSNPKGYNYSDILLSDVKPNHKSHRHSSELAIKTICFLYFFSLSFSPLQHHAGEIECVHCYAIKNKIKNYATDKVKKL